MLQKLTNLFRRPDRAVVPVARSLVPDAGAAAARDPVQRRLDLEGDLFEGGRNEPTVVNRYPGIRFPISEREAAMLEAMRGQWGLAQHVDPRALAVLARAFPGIERAPPHAGGYGVPPWNVAALLDAGPEVAAAISAYNDRNFIHLSPDEKRAVLTTLAPLLRADVQATLERLHLPRTLKNTSTHAVITKAIESETFEVPKIFSFYAPDPTGLLDKRAIGDEIKQKLLDPKSGWCVRQRNLVEQQYGDDTWLKALRWKDLAPDAQLEYLKGYEQTVDPKIVMHRITDPKHTATGELAPHTLQKTLKWEREQRLTIAELITDGAYVSHDQLLADRVWISAHFEGGFHLHAVAELVTPEDKQLLGPKLTAFAALQDLSSFATCASYAHESYTHVFLEPWQADDVNKVAQGFTGGTIPADEILVHKFHVTGMRTGIYGDENRVGVEIRGIVPNRPLVFDHAAERCTTLLAEGGIMRLPSPPWEGWDAGHKDVPAKWEQIAREQWKNDPTTKAAQLSFDDVFELVDKAAHSKNGFAFRSALWNYEAIPGMNRAEQGRFAEARWKFMGTLVHMSAAISRALEGGRDIDELAPKVWEHVLSASLIFFQEARVDEAVERILDDAAKAGSP